MFSPLSIHLFVGWLVGLLVCQTDYVKSITISIFSLQLEDVTFFSSNYFDITCLFV